MAGPGFTVVKGCSYNFRLLKKWPKGKRKRYLYSPMALYMGKLQIVGNNSVLFLIYIFLAPLHTVHFQSMNGKWPVQLRVHTEPWGTVKEMLCYLKDCFISVSHVLRANHVFVGFWSPFPTPNPCPPLVLFSSIKFQLLGVSWSITRDFAPFIQSRWKMQALENGLLLFKNITFGTFF